MIYEMTTENEDKSESCSLEYISCGCNRTTQALSWGCQGLIAYGGCNSVIIYQPKIEGSCGKIIAILNGHKSRVNCLQWLSNDEKKDIELISGSSDKQLIVWQRISNNQWNINQYLTGHNNAITALASVSYNNHTEQVSIIASASSDSTLKLWIRHNGNDFTCTQTISYGNGFVHAVALSELPHGKGIIMACGCDDSTVKLYYLQNESFILALTLTGHEDWVRSLAFTKTENDTDLLLASSSQDYYIRLWRVCSTQSETLKVTEVDISLKEESFISCNEKFTVVLESVLIGHEGWILGVSWSPATPESTPALLSSSMDKTMIVWEYDKENQVWIDQARMGDVGGNTLGYYGCAYGPDGCTIIAHGYQGAFKMWTKENYVETSSWKSCVTVSGHFNEVEDFDWEPRGEFAITASSDQTTRLHAPWIQENLKTTWHEIARPQVHGHDMKCIAMLDRYNYASGAQEKVVRLFAAPKAFYESFSHISQAQEDSKLVSSLPLGATVPVLGLSNKAVYEDDIQSWEKKSEKSSQPMKASAFANEDPAPFNPTLISEPPVEDVLLQNTLWPEVQKLYGHGFELFTIAASPDGSVLATACKASKPEYANILIWDTSSWTQKDSLFAHSLTVTQLCFSPCGHYLLSVSRDRTWALHKKELDNNSYKFTLVQKTDKKTSIHNRIIWSCDWSPDSCCFVTVSRDKKVLVWGVDNETQCWSVKGDPLDMGESVTAVSVSKTMTSNGRYIVALGTEYGAVSIFTFSEISPSWNCVVNVPIELCPARTVKRVKWRPWCQGKDQESKYIYLGVCSSDHSFRIVKFSSSIFL